MDMNKRCTEACALATFYNNLEKIKVEMMKPMEEDEKTEENFNVSLLFNDLPMNLKLVLLKPTKLEEVSKFSGASLSVKGRYIPPEERDSDTSKDQLLNLHIEGPTKQSILLALQMIEHLLKDIAGPEDKTPLCQVEKVLVGMEVAPAEFDLRGQVLGPEGKNLQYIVDETEAEVTLRGRGSGYQESDIGKESPEPLHIRVQHSRPEVVQAGRILALHLLEAVQREFAKYCSRHAQLMASPQSVSFQERGTPTGTANFLSDDSWSHNASMEEDLPESVTSSGEEEKDNPDLITLKSGEKELNSDQEEDVEIIDGLYGDERRSENGVEETGAAKPSEHVPLPVKKKKKNRGGKRVNRGGKINKYVETLTKLQSKDLSQKERKELIETLKYYKCRLASWWFVKKYGDKDFDIQYKHLCLEYHKPNISKEKKKQSSLQVSDSGKRGNALKLRPPLLPLPRPMSSDCMTPHSSPRPSFIPTLGTSQPRPRPQARICHPDYGPRPTDHTRLTHNNQFVPPAGPFPPHGWSSNQPLRGQQNNQNCTVDPHRRQWPEPHPSLDCYGDQRRANQEPRLNNPPNNEFSQREWHTQPRSQGFQEPTRYPPPGQSFRNSLAHQNHQPEQWQRPFSQMNTRQQTPEFWQNRQPMQMQNCRRQPPPSNFGPPPNSWGAQQ